MLRNLSEVRTPSRLASTTRLQSRLPGWVREAPPHWAVVFQRHSFANQHANRPAIAPTRAFYDRVRDGFQENLCRHERRFIQ